jgi:hypothetical protein
VTEHGPIDMPYREDHETWRMYSGTEYRWAFNKLEVALRQGLHAGPAGTAPEYSGRYIHRPTYNPFGMGIGAKKFYYDVENEEENFVSHMEIPSGHFWCEWLPGPHLSIDYRKWTDGRWRVHSVWEGEHRDEENLVKFSKWKRLPTSVAPNPLLWGNLLPWVKAGSVGVDAFNIETRSEKIIEIHLRLGNDTFDMYPVGTELFPVWEDEEVPTENFIANVEDDMTYVYESGLLSGKRLGFTLKLPS